MAADLIHHAHINIINKGKKYGSVIIGLMTDKGLESYKGKPIINYHNRKKIIEAIKNVDYVIPLNGLVYREIAIKIKCDFTLRFSGIYGLKFISIKAGKRIMVIIDKNNFLNPSELFLTC